MSDTPKTYLDDLAGRLRDRGLASGDVDDIVREAQSHLSEAGGDPVEALGSVDEFVEAVVSRGDVTGPTDGWEYRTVTGATAFNELKLLEEAGAEGWELIGCAPLQLHCRRRTEGASRWEYRREVGGPGRDAALARNGWELATTWMIFRYYRRALVLA